MGMITRKEWEVEVDNFGQFLTYSEHKNNGNFRITEGDIVDIFIPSGCIINQQNTQVVIESGCGDISKIPAVIDPLGNACISWDSENTSSGSVSLTIECEEFEESNGLNFEVGIPNVIKGYVNMLIVQPRIFIKNEYISQSSFAIQTILPRCLGKIDVWIQKLKRTTIDLNYNIVHLPPIQSLGESGSLYSISNQLEISKELLPDSVCASNDDAWNLLKETLRELESKYGVLVIQDIVLNHTSSDTKWLSSNPDCGYNNLNSPHLNAAIELDLQLQQLSNDIVDNKYQHLHVTSHIFTRNDVDRLLETVVLIPFQIEEWFSMDIPSINDEYLLYLSETRDEDIDSINDNILDYIYAECRKTIGISRNNRVRPSVECLKAIAKTKIPNIIFELTSVQERLLVDSKDVYEKIVNAISGFLCYEHLECKRGPINKNKNNGIAPRYFTPVITDKGDKVFLANNGWVMNWNINIDFASPGSLVYLDRSLIVWSDCVKLRYGNSENDCPFLWKLMTQYCEKVSSHFFGIRLDNCHSTPIHVTKYMMKKSRQTKKNIWVFAELFTGNQQTDLVYERNIGINALVREVMQSNNIYDLVSCVEKFGGPSIGTLDPIWCISRYSNKSSDTPQANILLPTPSLPILFDCTHDNKTPKGIFDTIIVFTKAISSEKFTQYDYLTLATMVTACNCAIGSTKGFDELVPKTLSVVDEYRTYYDYCSQVDSDINKTDEFQSDNDVKISTNKYLRCDTVHVRGSWDNWQTPLLLTKHRNEWRITVPHDYILWPPKSNLCYEFKFIADSIFWFHDPDLYVVSDTDNNMNNGICIKNNSNNEKRYTDAHLCSISGERLPGIMEIRKHLNWLHKKMVESSCNQIQIEIISTNVLVIKRFNPHTFEIFFFFIHVGLSEEYTNNWKSPEEYNFFGKLESFVIEAKLLYDSNLRFHDNDDFINGLSSDLLVSISETNSISSLCQFHTYYNNAKNLTTIHFDDFPPGSIFILKTQQVTLSFPYQNNLSDYLSCILPFENVDKNTIHSKIELLNYLLYSCSNEEMDISQNNRKCYYIPNLGELPYGGICSIVYLLDQIRSNENPHNHPLYIHLCSGEWLFNYITERLLDPNLKNIFEAGSFKTIENIGIALKQYINLNIDRIPPYSRLSFLDLLISTLYAYLSKYYLAYIGDPWCKLNDPFVIKLLLATLQFYNYVPSASLTYNIKHRSLCAGLPHFSTNYMRCWGRDTFIAFRGCFLVVKLFKEARDEILQYASVLRHGLIPNLLDQGNNPRYNARDSTFFFLQSIQDYCLHSDEGVTFLKTTVNCKYIDHLNNLVLHPISTLADIIHAILSILMNGIHFVEWNAGKTLDEYMTPQGFHIDIYTDISTGIIYGGNQFNCGTWMDKMGSSIQAGTAGLPATPRDGAAIECIGLLKSTLRFINSLPSDIFPYTNPHYSNQISYVTWETNLQNYVEKLFYIPDKLKKPETSVFHPHYVHKENIYRDTLSSSYVWTDYQLRPNFVVALAVAPELFDVDNALLSLKQVEKYLINIRSIQEDKMILKKLVDSGIHTSTPYNHQITDTFPYPTVQIGLKTLDPDDYNYRPFYSNSPDPDPHISNGFSYHNGPEWVWPLGYFLQALMKFKILKTSSLNKLSDLNEFKLKQTKKNQFECLRYLLIHRRFMQFNPYMSLPELCNANGSLCAESCFSQAWSVGTLVAFLSDICSITK